MMSQSDSTESQINSSPTYSKNLPNSVADWIATQIIEGKLLPGEKLNIRELAKQFGFSSTPVREALRSLEAEGLVELPQYRSPIVARITEKQVRDIYECRANLLGLAARLATTRIDADTIVDLNQIVEQMATAVADRSTQRYFALTSRFNEEIARISDNHVLSDLLQSLGRRTLRLRHLSTSLPGQLERGLEDHKKIMAAMEQRDATKVEQLTRQMLERSRDLILQHNLSQKT